jgi:hypothetical protein
MPGGGRAQGRHAGGDDVTKAQGVHGGDGGDADVTTFDARAARALSWFAAPPRVRK